MDTVELFYLPNRRMVKLSFLSALLLGKEIQTNTHCSEEDAIAALLLLRKYRQLKQDGTLRDTLQYIYKKGRECGWSLQGALAASSSSSSCPSLPSSSSSSCPSLPSSSSSSTA